MSTVDAFSSSVKMITEIPKDPTIIIGLRAFLAPSDPPRITGRRAITHGASTVRIPAKNEGIKSSISVVCKNL